MSRAEHTSEPSKGHIAWLPNDREVYADEKGDLWIAPTSNVIDCRNGYRIGRWECPSWQAEAALEMLRASR